MLEKIQGGPGGDKAFWVRASPWARYAKNPPGNAAPSKTTLTRHGVGLEERTRTSDDGGASSCKPIHYDAAAE